MTIQEIQAKIRYTESVANCVEENLLRAQASQVSGLDESSVRYERCEFSAELYNFNDVAGTADIRITARYQISGEKEYSAMDDVTGEYLARAINEMLPVIAKRAIEMARINAEDAIFDLKRELERISMGVA